jgi:CPA2 family monovalent cation:H+ antiporter-2
MLALDIPLPPLIASTGFSPLLTILAVLLVALVLMSLALTRLRQSLLIGYFACGVAAANSGLLERFAGSEVRERMEIFAETGVVLLMFTLGIEFSLAELRHLRRAAFVGGGLQVGLTVLLVALAAWFGGFGVVPSVVLGVALALSSTAVSMKAFQENGLSASPAARVSLGIAIFQDLAVIAFMLLLPALSGNGGTAGMLMRTVGLAVVFLGCVWLLGRHVIPHVLHAVARTRNRELFTLSVVTLCVSVASLASILGLSAALGAFVGGVVVSGSIYRHRIMADVLPFKDLFLTLFFVSVGLCVQLDALLRHWPWVLAFTAALLLVKGLLMALVARVLGMSLRSSVLAVAALASSGEFSLVLMARAREFMPWPDAFIAVFVMSTALSMALVPSLMQGASRLAAMLETRWGSRARKATSPDLSSGQKTKRLSDHVILCGYGPVGQRLHEALLRAGQECLIVELNVDTVRRLKKAGVPVLFADATHRETWELTRAAQARLVAFTYPDAQMTCAAIAHVREFAPAVTVLARVKFESDTEALQQARADHIVHDEGESADAMVRVASGAFDTMQEPREAT